MNLIFKTLLPSLVYSFLLLTAPARAQVTPDTTLGNEASRLTPNQVINGASTDRVDGGAQRGINLFHSFSQFNIRDGQRVYFGNPAGVQNILTRVTGASGNAGNTDIKAKLVRISDSSGIAAVTTSGTGGNIILNIDENLVLRTGGFISTTAGIQQAGGDGGNITINTPFIVADKRENSDITANAFTGRGGNVVIRTQGIFGIEPRVTESTETSDITASSQLGVQGEISITEPEVQPAQGLIELPEQVVDATRQVAQICPRQPGAKPLGEFTITGRGSLPPSPLEPLTGATNQQVLATLEPENSNNKAPVSLINNSPAPQIAEAQGWVKTSDGGVELVAVVPTVTPKSNTVIANCPVVQ
ncbi:hypothetical protein DSM106972_094670 [Dulcicalothrix desertica PCC 7102]|uniref:Filamentous haemagglutinin FhaB/tRNA nuclease CdiA-like TPS domain-containing protein n=1 Tax=Dulcicalothrix desertica PCC 7102 TaxID=232991 RepID=A0A3S1BSB2_9CYAN|nr:hypothetical protein [Dulcicalothrix desertica]RUS93996.1 hypothetical protein DSM106972_094670 [Dulcicalothrix desertica PCC 7102]TWH62677.1 filamentous hemagglutinin family protein [Dulcicalothrix desertica PCC 7102]